MPGSSQTRYTSSARAMYLRVLLVGTLLNVYNEVLGEEQPEAVAETGIYKGYFMTSASGRQFAAFSGIRYAKPPIGELRFHEVAPLRPSTKEILATQEGSECLQIDPVHSPNHEISGDEDCLFLNIYSPTVKGSFPVMVWLHGGGWYFGSGSKKTYGPELLLDQDIVLVTINYRLGLFGFSSLEDGVYPGNLGLKDQREALKWIQKNINAFGGNPENVMLAGQSAGAASVHYHLVSPDSKGLFHKGISQSGTMMAPWAKAQTKQVRSHFTRLASAVNCSSADSQKLLECLRGVPMMSLMEAEKNAFGVLERNMIIWRPQLDETPELQRIFNPHKPLMSTHVELPWIVGVTAAEAAFLAGFILKTETGWELGMINQFFDVIAPILLDYSEDSAGNLKGVNSAVKEFYFGVKSGKLNISLQNLGPFVNVLSDAWFTVPAYESSVRHNGPIFSYYFDRQGCVSVLKAMEVSPELGATHGDDVAYIFNFTKVNIYRDGTDEDRAFSKQMVKLWAGFAKNGTPTQPTDEFQWKPWTKDERSYLHMSLDGFHPRTDNHIIKDRLKFWRNLRTGKLLTPEQNQ